MIKEAEEIILAKNYNDLSKDELDIVSDLVQNETEFEEMKWLLGEVNHAYKAEKIEPSKALKQNVLKHLTASNKKKGFWLNRVGVFLLPTDKNLFQKPGIQIGMAAVVVLGLLFFVNKDFNTKKLAINEENKISNTQPNQGLNQIKDTEMSEVLQDDLSMEKTNDESKNNLVAEDIMPVSMPNTTNADVNELDLKDRPDIFESEEVYAESDDYGMESVVSIPPVAEQESAKELMDSPNFSQSRNDVKLEKSAAKKKAYIANESYDAIDYASSANEKDRNEEKSEEVIIPKSLYMSQTNELNRLFYTVK
jgi:hypothetical protein